MGDKGGLAVITLAFHYDDLVSITGSGEKPEQSLFDIICSLMSQGFFFGLLIRFSSLHICI